LHLWDLLADFTLQPDVEGTYVWQFSSTGQYSSKSAYDSLFLGAIQFRPWERIWKTWAPAKCQVFVWLVTHNRNWTAESLIKRGVPHPEKCPLCLCDQEGETIDHLLTSCVFARLSPAEGGRRYSRTLLLRLYLNETTGRGPGSRQHGGAITVPSRRGRFLPNGDKAICQYRLDDLLFCTSPVYKHRVPYSPNKLC
jgi:hypothetical protein